MDLFAKARELGIQTEYIDGQGHRHVTDAAALQIIVDALPVRIPYRFLDQAVVVRLGAARRGPNSARPPDCRCAGKSLREHRVIADGETHDRTVVWPADLPVGLLPAASDRRFRLHRAGAVDRRAAAGIRRRFRPLLAAGGAALWRPVGAQLGDRGFHRPRRPDRARRQPGRRRRRPQSAACPVRRPPRRLQPLFAEQPAVSQPALYRRRKTAGISARVREQGRARRGCGRAIPSIMPPLPS